MSEQDFFFDEEPETKAPDTKSTKTPAKASPRPAASTSAPVATASDDVSSSYAVAALVGVIGLLLGAILGFLLGNALATNSANVAPSANVPAATSTGAAPQLTPEQLSTNELPAGHPSVSASGSLETSPAP